MYILTQHDPLLKMDFCLWFSTKESLQKISIGLRYAVNPIHLVSYSHGLRTMMTAQTYNSRVTIEDV